MSKLRDRIAQHVRAGSIRAGSVRAGSIRAGSTAGRPADQIRGTPESQLRGRQSEELSGQPQRRADPSPGARNYVLLVLDSLRFDSLMAAAPTVLPKLGPIQRRHSYATWTAPAHYNLMMGLLPHPAPQGVFASTWYRQDFASFADRLAVPGLDFSGMLPSLWMPDHLRNRLGYRTSAIVSMPVLNPHTPINRSFDRYESAPAHNDLSAIIDRMDFDPDRPDFWLLNTGETHYPYAAASEPEEEWPVIHGVNGVFKQLAGGQPLHRSATPRFFDQKFFDQDRLDALRQRQIAAAASTDQIIEKLLDTVPDNTWVTVTSDHGELFGEGGWFGHGPIPHEKVLEVPLVEGLAR